MGSLCAHCGTPVKFVRALGGHVHDVPLGAYPLSRRELQDVLADPIPPGHRVIHRQTVLHPAQPGR